MTAAQAQEQADWFHSQQEYWEKTFQTQQAQWTELLNRWQSGAATADGYQRFFTQGGQQFLDMMHTFQRSATEQKPATDAVRDWASQMRDFFGKVVQVQDAADTYKNMMNIGENMIKATQAWSSVFQDSRTFSPGGGLGNYDPFGFFATMPGIGYTREKHEEYAKLYRLWHAYEAAMKKYNASMAAVGIESTQKFYDYIAAPPKDAPPMTSLKSVYGKWVDICESVFSKHALTKEYSVLYGETVNAMMAFKKQMNKVADDVMDDLNLPTRKEVDVLHERMHELRRDNIELKKAVALLLKGKGGRVAKAAKPKAVKAVKAVKAKPAKAAPAPKKAAPAPAPKAAAPAPKPVAQALNVSSPKKLGKKTTLKTSKGRR